MDSKETLPAFAPGEDFYQFINEDWLEHNQIPPSEVMWGPWNELALSIRKSLIAIAENAKNQTAKKGSNEQLVGDFFASGTNMDTRNQNGIKPLNDLRKIIDGVTNGTEAIQALAKLELQGTSAFIDTGFAEDDKKAGSNAFYIGQGGLGLPNREYYLSDEDSMQEIRAKYKEHISTLFQLAGRSAEDADKSADTVIAFEHQLAEASLPEEETREADKNYFKFTLEQAKSEFPNIDWDSYFTTLGKPDVKDFVIQQPGFIKKVGELLHGTDSRDIRDYLEFQLLDDWAGTLSDDFVAENFHFHGQVLAGQEEPKPLDEKVIQALHSTILSDAIGPLYCEQHFDQQTKVKIMVMVEDVREAFRERVRDLDWMTPETKELTWKKLDNIVFKMGYPDKWPDVSGANVRPDDYVGNLMRLAEFDIKKRLKQLDEPFDKSEWLMPPTLVNACSDLKREMTYPAAILHYPFYDTARDDAYNYGAIGMVVGHELSHFFDDQGCKFDLEGNLNDWWNDQDREQFQSKTSKFVEYFGSLQANDMQVNGQLTLGENIADVAGIIVAFEALRLRLTKENRLDEIVDGMTWQQRFFVGYAKVWAEKIRPEVAKELIITDPHAPSEVRVNGVLAINDEFHKAFDVKAGDKMYVAPEHQPVLW